ncbi:replication initiation protein [Noviherbaspirillum pedocola]|uniref:Replication initiation protein n=1 Tax=Noviherbaspirillum pedocola TaxID=2801341 RepID=A0A934SVT4_9BURK|nr:replication initiation protein [Noviherbaspirillum pedocola]MBK4733697.1 replication initiation protein [Noviherbaspirillum pedocola]
MLDTFIKSLPEKVRCSNNPGDEGTKFRSKEEALQYKYVEHNQSYKKYLIIDIDIDKSANNERIGPAFRYEEKGMPVPSIITINPEKGTPHYQYELNTPVIFTPNARKEPQQLYEAVTRALIEALQGDRSYDGHLTKNPLCPYWKVIRHDVSYDLKDFLEYVDIKNSFWKKPITHDILGRNHTLFNNLRFWAYQEVRKHADLENFKLAVEDRAFQINEEFQSYPQGQLGTKEVLQIAKSVSRWTWRNRYDLDRHGNRGVMRLWDKDLALDEKQRLSAERTHKEQTNTTRSALFTSITLLKAQGIPITQKSLEIHSKISLSTIKRYWKEFEPIIYKKMAA